MEPPTQEAPSLQDVQMPPLEIGADPGITLELIASLYAQLRRSEHQLREAQLHAHQESERADKAEAQLADQDASAAAAKAREAGEAARKPSKQRETGQPES